MNNKWILTEHVVFRKKSTKKHMKKEREECCLNTMNIVEGSELLLD